MDKQKLETVGDLVKLLSTFDQTTPLFLQRLVRYSNPDFTTYTVDTRTNLFTDDIVADREHDRVYIVFPAGV